MVITPQAWVMETETLLSDSKVLTQPGGFEPATPKSLAWPRATGLSGQLPNVIAQITPQPGPLRRGKPIPLFQDATHMRQRQELRTFDGCTIAHKTRHANSEEDSKLGRSCYY
jgi:hypothetical protein